ncbi:hypothetical protein DFJ73DRAFT_827286, partial [Zopfochytrium polystomum]
MALMVLVIWCDALSLAANPFQRSEASIACPGNDSGKPIFGQLGTNTRVGGAAQRTAAAGTMRGTHLGEGEVCRAHDVTGGNL